MKKRRFEEEGVGWESGCGSEIDSGGEQCREGERGRDWEGLRQASGCCRVEGRDRSMAMVEVDLVAVVSWIMH